MSGWNTASHSDSTFGHSGEAVLLRQPRALEVRDMKSSQDAALVTALAATAMPFAHTAEDQAESWLRTMRLHGRVADSLHALGVGEKPLVTGSTPSHQAVGTPVPEGDVVERVVASAADFVVARGGECIGTGDLLFGVFDIYGNALDRALYLRGTSRAQLFDQLALDQYHART